MAPIEVIVNASGGSFVSGKAEDELRDAFAALERDLNLHLVDTGAEIDSVADTAARSNANIIVAGGGDGTINAVAGHVVDATKTLGVLPLGTLNHFSKDLGIPQNLPGAVEVIAR